ncbi:hypothetical protein CFELI_12115 [Corynebacterium felinum]|nr:hypothetical protein CFELI_12115 [Corynebacterium felinum]
MTKPPTPDYPNSATKHTLSLPGKLIYVANRGSDTISVIDPATLELKANLRAGTLPNHISIDPQGEVFAVNKAAQK